MTDDVFIATLGEVASYLRTNHADLCADVVVAAVDDIKRLRRRVAVLTEECEARRTYELAEYQLQCTPQVRFDDHGRPAANEQYQVAAHAKRKALEAVLAARAATDEMNKEKVDGV